MLIFIFSVLDECLIVLIKWLETGLKVCLQLCLAQARRSLEISIG